MSSAGSSRDNSRSASSDAAADGGAAPSKARAAAAGGAYAALENDVTVSSHVAREAGDTEGGKHSFRDSCAFPMVSMLLSCIITIFLVLTSNLPTASIIGLQALIWSFLALYFCRKATGQPVCQHKVHSVRITSCLVSFAATLVVVRFAVQLRAVRGPVVTDISPSAVPTGVLSTASVVSFASNVQLAAPWLYGGAFAGDSNDVCVTPVVSSQYVQGNLTIAGNGTDIAYAIWAVREDCCWPPDADSVQGWNCWTAFDDKGNRTTEAGSGGALLATPPPGAVQAARSSQLLSATTPLFIRWTDNPAGLFGWHRNVLVGVVAALVVLSPVLGQFGMSASYTMRLQRQRREQRARRQLLAL